MKTLFIYALLAGSVFLSTDAAANSITASTVDSKGAPLQHTVVYAIPKGGPVPARVRREVEIAQQNQQFVPPVTVIQTGSSIRFPNRDTVRHHVYSFSPPKVFEIKLYLGTPTTPVVFDKPGMVVLGCNIHDHMRAYVQIVDTPYFGVTDAKGQVTLGSLPAGEYEIVVWHFQQDAHAARQVVRIASDQPAAARFVLGLSPAMAQHK